MKFPVIPLTACIDDWIVKSGRTLESLDEELILTVAADVTRLSVNRQQYQEYVSLLPVRDYTAQLPKDFAYVIQVAFKEEVDECCIKERVSEWVGKVNDCKITTHIDCPTCGEAFCDCGTPFLEVDTNFIWETANPQIFNSHVKHYYRHGNLTSRDSCYYHPEWELARKKTDNYFHTPHHIRNCLNFKSQSPVEYDIVHPVLKFNRRHGAALLAYLALPTDENGLPYVPDIPEMFQAVFYSIEEMLSLQDYLQTGGQREAMKYERMKAEATRWRTYAKGRLRTWDQESFKNFLRHTWKRVLPAFPESEYRFNVGRSESRFTTFSSLNAQPDR